MTSPLAQVQVSINGGPWVSGGINAVPFGAVVAFQNSTTSGIRSYVWELVDYPPGLSLPAGWIGVNNVYTFYGQTPPNVTMPASGYSNWGKVAIRLRLNGNPLQFDATGALQQSYVQSLTDVATMLSLPSPNLQMPGFAFTEATQYDSMRSWPGAVMANLRAIEGNIGAISGNLGWVNLNHSTSGTVLTNTQPNVTLNTNAGPCVVIFPTAPFDGMRITFKDPPTTPATNTGCNWLVTPGQVQGSAGQYVEIPAAPGTFNAPGVATNLPQYNGADQDYKWHAPSSAWLLV